LRLIGLSEKKITKYEQRRCGSPRRGAGGSPRGRARARANESERAKRPQFSFLNLSRNRV